MHKKSVRRPPRLQYSSATESFKDRDPMGSTVMKPSIANTHVKEFVTPKWNREKAKLFEPYNDHKYNRVSHLPPNEVAFMGGLGAKRGNARSQVHIDRPTEVQKIFHMRTSNRGLYNFTEDPKKTRNVVKHRPVITKQNEPEKVKTIVDKVWMADNFEEKAKSSESDSVYLTRRVRRQVQPAPPEPALEYVAQVRNRLEDTFRIPDELLETRETFTDWAIRERERFKQRRMQMAEKQERSVTETLSHDSDAESYETVSERIRRTRRREVIQHIGGYMYGQFTKIPKKSRKSTKFGIPLSMIERAKEESEILADKAKQLRRARIAHMRLPIFFDEEDSEEDDVLETVKALTLVRTPFLRVPRIKTQQKRRRDRLKSKYLKRDRLNRITMLLYDRSYDPLAPVEEKKKKEKLRKIEKVDKKADKKESEMSPQRKKYVTFIRGHYSEQMRKYEKEQAGEQTSFEQFKETEKLDASRAKSATPADDLETKIDEDVFPPLKSKKNIRFDKSDEATGPFYIDIEQMEKTNDPTRLRKLPKYYTSLMRSQSNIRNRLTVAGNDFEDERCGVPGEYSHRLITEFDSFYIHELNYRKPVRKFRPKSDIIKIRNSVRKKFIDYYIQENLNHLQRKQTEEKKYLDDVDKLRRICEPLFDKKKFEYFQHMNKTIASLAPSLIKTEELEKIKSEVVAELEVVNNKLIVVEILFAHYLNFMNFYKRMLPPSWKMENTELFEGFQRSLDFLLMTSKRLKDREPEFVAHGDEEMEAYDFQLPEASSELLKAGIESIKFRIKGQLCELVHIMWLADKIVQEYNRMTKVFPIMQENMTKNIIVEDKKLGFLEERNYVMKYNLQELEKKSLDRCVKNPIIRKISAICDQICKTSIPQHLQNRHQKNDPVIEKFGFIQDYVLDLLHELDDIPVEIVKEATKEVKLLHDFTIRQAQKSVVQQNRFELMKKQLKFHFTTKKIRRKGRSPSPFQVKKG